MVELAMITKIYLESKPTIPCASFPTTFDFIDTNGAKYYFYYRYGNWGFCHDNYNRDEMSPGSFSDKNNGECTWEDAKQAMLSQGYEIIENF